MSSELAMKKHYGKMAKYRSSEGRVIKNSLQRTIREHNFRLFRWY